jgi:hypothetical protein
MNTITRQSGIVPIFATPFASIDTGVDRSFNERLASLCESRRRTDEKLHNPAPDALHFRSAEDVLSTSEEPASELKRVILRQASDVVAGLNDRSAAEFAQLHIEVRGWCSIVQPKGHIAAQHFPRASWIAVYCVQSGAPTAGYSNAGVLRVYESRLSSTYLDASNWTTMKEPYRYGNRSWPPQPGWMALFPAHLQHEVSVVRASTALILVFAAIRFMESGTPDSRYR